MRKSNRHKSPDPNHGRKLIDPSLKSVVEKHFKGQVLPRGFYEAPNDDSIRLWLFDPELHDWIVGQTGWTKARAGSLLTMLCRKVIGDKLNDCDLYDTRDRCRTIGVNLGTWTIHVWKPNKTPDVTIQAGLLMGLTLDRIADILAPDWHKTAFDF